MVIAVGLKPTTIKYIVYGLHISKVTNIFVYQSYRIAIRLSNRIE